jgi:cobalt/nickel transport system permease protein
MHIPDGYLSPATCAVLYAGAAPFWYVALRRVRRAMHTRLVPVLSLVAAFSFVVMMFNIPLPGGTTGHAVGVGVATVVLGPAASMLAVSIALVIQAFFFGDGGITAIGANCLNMAVVGSLTAHVVYRAVSGRVDLGSRLRWMAAAAAGYAAVNASALCAAVEFGIQPMLYRDAAGAPLYAPYPLGIAVPAMMLGHLTVAGAAEALLSAGVVAFIQRTDPGVLRLNPAHAAALAAPASARHALRSLWLGLGVLMLLTPLGIMAAGTAWGEWAASDFASPAGRQEIAAASLKREPPAGVPAGLERLSSAWTAPWADYAPRFVRSPAIGYLLSAMFGVGLVVLLSGGIARALALRRRRGGPAPGEVQP